MIVILAEKEDMAAKIAGAFECVRLKDGTEYQFKDIEKHSKAIKEAMRKMSHLEVLYKGQKMFITWAKGHLCSLKNAVDYNPDYGMWSKLPVPFIPESFELKITKGMEWRMKVITDLFSKAALIINACDKDREGDTIFGYIYEMSGSTTPYKRALLNEVTRSGIVDAFEKHNLISSSAAMPVQMAGRARGVADWVVGANLTAQMTLKHTTPGSKITLSMGRVQTPVLKMMVDREIAIRNFKSKPFWVVEALFKTPAGEEFKAVHTSERFEDKTVAQSILTSIAGKRGVVTAVDKKNYSKKPPSLYSTDTLQMDANTAFGLTLTQTQEALQKLYESGYTTYPRTDSAYLSDDMEPVIQSALKALETLPQYNGLLAGVPRVIANKKDYFDSSKVSGHHAIIPTHSVPKSLGSNEQKVYDLIAKSIIRMIYPSAKGELVKAHIDVDGEAFIANGSTVLDMGWLAVGGTTKEKYLPTFSKGDSFVGDYSMREGKTIPPKAFTDASLVAAMRSAGADLPDADMRKLMSDPNTGGIGRPSTRNRIPEMLIERGYAERKGKTLRATDMGIKLVSIIPCAELTSPELTAVWETRLNKIADRTDTYDAFVKDIFTATRRWCGDITAQASSGLGGSSGGVSGASGTTLVCPLCGSPVRKLNWGWGCSAYQSGCNFKVFNTVAKKKLTDKQAETLITHGLTPVIKGFTGPKGKFDSRLKYDASAGKVVFERK